MVASARIATRGRRCGRRRPHYFFLQSHELDLVNNQRRIYLFRRNGGVISFHGWCLLGICIHNDLRVPLKFENGGLLIFEAYEN